MPKIVDISSSEHVNTSTATERLATILTADDVEFVDLTAVVRHNDNSASFVSMYNQDGQLSAVVSQVRFTQAIPQDMRDNVARFTNQIDLEFNTLQSGEQVLTIGTESLTFPAESGDENE